MNALSEVGVSLSSFWHWFLSNPTVAICTLFACLLLLVLWWDAGRLLFAQTPIDQRANQRAEALLRENISAYQYAQLSRYGYVEIPSKVHPNRCYRIPRRRQRVQVLQSGQKLGELCVVPLEPVPHADLILTHKWMIEADEEGYLALANWIC